MARTAFSEQIRDTNTHSERSRYSVNNGVLQIVNDLDAEVSLTFYGTHMDDTSGDDAVQLGTLTVGADTVDREALSEPWDQIVIKAVASSSPTRGDLCIYTHDEAL